MLNLDRRSRLAGPCLRQALLGTLLLGGLYGQSTWAVDAPVAAQQASGSGALRAVASPSFGSPIAYGASWGAVGFGLFGQTIRSKGDPRSEDGSLGLALGFGDSVHSVGFETDVALTSLTGRSGDGFGQTGQVGAKLHKVLPGDWAVAVGAESLSAWGGLHGQEPSAYAVVTKIAGFHIGSRPFTVVANLGGGQGRFGYFGKDAQADLDDHKKFGPFGSLGLYVSPRVSLVVDSTPNISSVALSLVPIRSWPLNVSVGALNVLKQYDSAVDYAVTVGYGFNWRNASSRKPKPEQPREETLADLPTAPPAAAAVVEALPAEPEPEIAVAPPAQPAPAAAPAAIAVAPAYAQPAASPRLITLTFDAGRADLDKDSAAALRAAIPAIQQALAEHPRAALLIEAFADQDSDGAAAASVARARANQLRRTLEQLGINRSLLRSVGYAPQTGAEYRRAELVLDGD